MKTAPDMEKHFYVALIFKNVLRTVALYMTTFSETGNEYFSLDNL
jgi:hypothetical protein